MIMQIVTFLVNITILITLYQAIIIVFGITDDTKNTYYNGVRASAINPHKTLLNEALYDIKTPNNTSEKIGY